MRKKSNEVKSHRKRFSRCRFINIIINNDLKIILDTFKEIVANKENKNYKVSYNDVIIYLIKEFLKKELYFKTKSFSLNFPTQTTSFRTKTKSFSFNFENR